MKLRRKIIQAEFGIEKIIQQNGKFIVGVVIYVGDVSVGDTFNYLYKVRTFEVGEHDSGEFRVEIFNLREVSLEIKSIKFRGEILSTLSQGYSAEIELSGEELQQIKAPDDVLGKIAKP